MAQKMKALDMTSWLLCTLAGLQLGLVGAFNFDLLGMLGAGIAKILYIIIGLGALYSLWHLVTCKKK